MYAKDTPPLSIRAKQDLIDKLTQMAVERGTTRTKLINEALAFYVGTKRCVMCGAVNPGDGVHCAVCGALLYDDEKIKKMLIKLGDWDTYADLNKDDYEDKLPMHILGVSSVAYRACTESGLLQKVTPIIDRNVSPPAYACEIQFLLKDGKTRVRLVSEENTYLQIPNEVLYVGLLDDEFGDGDLFKNICSGKAGEIELKDFVCQISDIADFNYNTVLDFLM